MDKEKRDEQRIHRRSEKMEAAGLKYNWKKMESAAQDRA